MPTKLGWTLIVKKGAETEWRPKQHGFFDRKVDAIKIADSDYKVVRARLTWEEGK